MKLFRRILTMTAIMLVWAGIVFYIVWASGKGKERRQEARIERIDIRIADSPKVNIVTTGMVYEWLNDGSLTPPVGSLTSGVDTREIVSRVTADPIVADAKSYIDMGNVLYVSLHQRVPVMRFVMDSGEDFYITSDNYVLPAGEYSAQYVPIVTGSFDLPFEKGFAGAIENGNQNGEFFSDKSYTFFINLINFVNYIREDDFWNAQIVQINVRRSIVHPAKPVTREGSASSGNRNKEPVLELVPRAGNHIIILGAPDNYRSKLDKLFFFYRHAFAKEGWENWDYIDLRFAGQVVCR